MSSDQQSTRDGERLAVEPKLQDPRPQERQRNRSTLRLLVAGGALGAAFFAIAVWVIGTLVGNGYGGLTYVVAAAVGGAVGMVIVPVLSLARQDGGDAEVVRNRRPGRADAPIEGAEAIDEGRAVRSGEHR